MMNYLLIALGLLYIQSTFQLKSPEFANGNYIPHKFTCSGTNTNPALTLENIPENAQSLALIMDDPDSPNGEFVHWVMWNIPVNKKIQEKTSSGVFGKNSRKENKYYGPCPPNGIHHYHFNVYALDSKLNLPDSTGKEGLLTAMKGHILSKAELIGLYKDPGIGK